MNQQLVAALFVDPKGPYPLFSNVDCWPEARDARLYTGPRPVVAHPPCQLWGKFAPINFKRWGGEHNRPGNDGGCFASALANVRRCGGVLEHPAQSAAWSAHGLEKPIAGCWLPAGPCEWVCEVYQSAYGHLAQKRTWLFYAGSAAPIQADWRKLPGTHQCGHDSKSVGGNKPVLRGRKASETPILFAAYLISLARNAQ